MLLFIPALEAPQSWAVHKSSCYAALPRRLCLVCEAYDGGACLAQTVARMSSVHCILTTTAFWRGAVFASSLAVWTRRRRIRPRGDSRRRSAFWWLRKRCGQAARCAVAPDCIPSCTDRYFTRHRTVWITLLCGVGFMCGACVLSRSHGHLLHVIIVRIAVMQRHYLSRLADSLESRIPDKHTSASTKSRSALARRRWR